jgi:SNF2 family DNA or RNA helicase
MGTSIGHGTLLERTKFRRKRVPVIVNGSIMNNGLMNVQNWLTEESRLNYSGNRTQVASIKIN